MILAIKREQIYCSSKSRHIKWRNANAEVNDESQPDYSYDIPTVLLLYMMFQGIQL